MWRVPDRAGSFLPPERKRKAATERRVRRAVAVRFILKAAVVDVGFGGWLPSCEEDRPAVASVNRRAIAMHPGQTEKYFARG